MAESQPRNVMDPGQGDYGRLIGLTDGLIATVLTVLVLDLRFPAMVAPVTDLAVRTQFFGVSDKLWTYLLTFLVGMSFWMGHKRDFDYIQKYDRALFWMNGTFLLCVSLLPFTTYLVGSYLTPLTWLAYALDVAMAEVSLAGIWGYAAATGLLAPEVPAAYASYLLWRHLIMPVLFLASILFAQFNPKLASWMPIVLPPLYLLLGRMHAGGSLRVERAVSTTAGLWRMVAYVPLLVIGAVVILLNLPR
jgi:uncharacterized membrane protein